MTGIWLWGSWLNLTASFCSNNFSKHASQNAKKKVSKYELKGELNLNLICQGLCLSEYMFELCVYL